MGHAKLAVNLTVALALAFTACGGHDSTTSNRLASQAGSGTRPIRERPPASLAGRPHNARSPVNHWSLNVQGAGLPKLGGSIVMAATMPGGITQYAFVGGKQMSNLMIKGAAPYAPGTYAPYSLSIGFTDRKISCSTSVLDKKNQVIIKIEHKAGGVHATIDGTVTCSPVGKPHGKRAKAKLHGWFDR